MKITMEVTVSDNDNQLANDVIALVARTVYLLRRIKLVGADYKVEAE